MQFWAFMKDSYREALSGWVLQAMLVLTALLILFVASVSFHPIDLKDEVAGKFAILNWALSRQPDPGLRNSQYSIENFSQSNGAEPWKSDYRFDVVLKTPSPDDLKKIKEVGFPTRRQQVEGMMSAELPFLKDMKVTEEPPPAEALPQLALGGGVVAPVNAGELRFVVTTHGTKAEDALAWRHEPTIFFALDMPVPMSLREGVYTLEKRLVNDAGAWITLLVSVIITAGFIPNMLRKGTLDLYIAKPVSRPVMLVYKYLGGLLYVLILTSATVFGVWAVIGLRTGVWTPQFLALIPLLTFYFAILYSVSTLVGVLTRSMLVAIVATVFAWGVFFAAGFVYDKVQQVKKGQQEIQKRLEQAVPKGEGAEESANTPPPPLRQVVPGWADITARVVRGVLPRTYDLDDRAIRFIAEGVLTDEERKQKQLDQPLAPWPETIGVSGLFIVLMLALASWRLSTRDG